MNTHITADPLDLYVGKQVADMHGSDPRYHKRLNVNYDVRNVVSFSLRGQPEAAASFTRMMQHLNRGYTNKYLVVIGSDNFEGEWYPCAWSYDGAYGGVCEIRQKKIVPGALTPA